MSYIINAVAFKPARIDEFKFIAVSEKTDTEPCFLYSCVKRKTVQLRPVAVFSAGER